jgi:hypothetical protein
MLITSTLSPDAKITPEMKKEIEEAKKMPITFDEDCPELTENQLKQFECMLKMRNRLISNFEKKTHRGNFVLWAQQ